MDRTETGEPFRDRLIESAEQPPLQGHPKPGWPIFVRRLPETQGVT
ncbi:MAG: hypothetical protein U0795_23235 [Pirellulales bacterium]